MSTWRKEKPLHAVVREMVGTLSFPARHLVQFKPKMARWNVHVLRCKRKTTFLLDDRFAATVNCMSEHTFDVEKGQVIELDLKMEQHTEVEVSIVRLRLTVHDIINVLLTAAAQLGLGMCVWSRCRLLLKPGAVLAHWEGISQHEGVWPSSPSLAGWSHHQGLWHLLAPPGVSHRQARWTGLTLVYPLCLLFTVSCNSHMIQLKWQAQHTMLVTNVLHSFSISLCAVWTLGYIILLQHTAALWDNAPSCNPITAALCWPGCCHLSTICMHVACVWAELSWALSRISTLLMLFYKGKHEAPLLYIARRMTAVLPNVPLIFLLCCLYNNGKCWKLMTTSAIYLCFSLLR